MSRPFRALVPDAIRESYARKFAVILAVLGVSVLLAGIVTTGQMQQELNDRADQQYASFASQEAQALQSWHSTNRNQVRRAAESNELNAPDDEARQDGVEAWIHRMANETQAVRYVSYESGTVVASTAADRGADLESVDAPWGSETSLRGLDEDETAPAVQHDDIFVTDVYTETVDGESVPVVSYAVPVPSFRGAYVVATYRLDQYLGANVVGKYDASDVALVDSAGRGVSTAGAGVQDYSGETLTAARDAESAGSIREGSAPGPFGGLLFGGSGDLVGHASTDDGAFTVLLETPMAVAYPTDIVSWGLLGTFVGVGLIGAFGTAIGMNTARSIDRLRGKAERMEAGDFDVELETERVDNIGRLYGAFGSMRDALRGQIEQTEHARAETESLNVALERQADEYSDVMQACADGDFTRRMDVDGESEAMTAVAEEFNEMMDEIEATVDRLKAFSDRVAHSTQQVATSAEMIREESAETTNSLTDISADANAQNETLQTASDDMVGHLTTIEAMADSSNEVATISRETAETGREGRQAAERAIESMREIEAHSGETVAEMERLEAEVEQVDELIEFISDVAEQTNMLALNANIEASRAGESGEGFAVVANEIKSLASETKTAAGDIEERLERIQEQTERTVAEVRENSDRVSANTGSVEDAVDALDEIAGYAQETNDGVQAISESTEEQAASTEHLVRTVDEAAAISQETAVESEFVATAAETQTEALEEMSESAGDLAEKATRLSDALDRFETAESASDEGDAELEDADESVAGAVEEADPRPEEELVPADRPGGGDE
ncbi:methyl-accepting chemotaxis protein [Halomarina litorea]|uniref:methyl-accepting chemotaxis protein n=1 Tax=Halomarina litorea TaxID=2961595 RepID=UPI0020C40DD9|nr:methyl-accepting chemotaxis protein [Halomarina sp. BCD28]